MIDATLKGYDIIWATIDSEGCPCGTPDGGKSAAERHAQHLGMVLPGLGPYNVATYLKASPAEIRAVWTALSQFIDNTIEAVELGLDPTEYNLACKLRDRLDAVFAEVAEDSKFAERSANEKKSS